MNPHPLPRSPGRSDRRSTSVTFHFQSVPDGVYKFLLNYQDHSVKFYDCIATPQDLSLPPISIY